MSRVPDVVLDTNAVLSALLFPQAHAATLRQAWQEGGVRPLASHDTIAELQTSVTNETIVEAGSEQARGS